MEFIIFLALVGVGVAGYFWLTKMGGMEKVDQKAKELVDKISHKEPEKIGNVVLTKPETIVPPSPQPVVSNTPVPMVEVLKAKEEEEEKEVSVEVEKQYADLIASPVRPSFFSPMSPEEVAIQAAWDKAHSNG